MAGREENRRRAETPERPAGEELLVHFYFSEQESQGFKVLAAFSIFWFAAVFGLARYLGLFEYVSTYPMWLKVVMLLFAGIPVLLVTYVTLRFFWWLAPALANFSEWGRGRTWARHLWFWLLVIGSFVALDPFDIILKRLALVEQVELTGIGSFNPLQALYWGLAALSAILLCWYYLKQAAELAWEKLNEWWEYAVSLPLGLRISLTHMFRRNFTFYYPEQTLEIPDYFRGKHRLVFDEHGKHLCIACQLCMKVCPDGVILVSAVRNPETKKQELTGFLVDNSRCCFCGLCEDVCPTGAIRLSNEFAYSSYDRGDLVLDIYQEYLERSAPLRNRRAGRGMIHGKRTTELASAAVGSSQGSSGGAK
ncbi:MAG: hypothetical protein B1H03_06885 [Planctomycetales bacterium 4484_113]|nr:MAG: hypothetical protein B1H03_06885 [Planctomycetales bacterium 4484_113]